MLTVLIESHAELSLCMRMHALLSSISSEGWLRGGELAYSSMSSVTDSSLLQYSVPLTQTYCSFTHSDLQAYSL